jgi:hypothetical protein
MFARYSLIGALSAAFGALAAASPQFLAAAGLDGLTAIKAMFALYALLGVAGCFLYSRIPRLPPIASGGMEGALGPSRHIVYRLAALFSLQRLALYLGTDRRFPDIAAVDLRETLAPFIPMTDNDWRRMSETRRSAANARGESPGRRGRLRGRRPSGRQAFGCLWEALLRRSAKATDGAEFS